MILDCYLSLVSKDVNPHFGGVGPWVLSTWYLDSDSVCLGDAAKVS
jgi:hypothetical protein